MSERVSQEVVEVVQDASPNVRVSQLTAEVLQDAQGNVRVSQIPVEVVQDAHGNVRISQQTVQAILDAFPGIRVSQIVIEAVGIFIEVPMPQVYPSLPGLSYPVGWAFDFQNLTTQVASSGAEIDLGLVDTPLHTFSLQYEVARDNFGFSEQKLLRGFFGAMRGNLVRFLFWWVDDHQIKSQQIGTTDGSTRVYTLTRTYGVGEASWTEPVGYVDQTMPFNVYLDGVLQAPISYTIDTTLGAQQQIIFAGTPSAGKVITVDMDYFYYCKFKDPAMSLDKFMNLLWSGGKIELRSCRPGA